MTGLNGEVSKLREGGKTDALADCDGMVLVVVAPVERSELKVSESGQAGSELTEDPRFPCPDPGASSKALNASARPTEGFTDALPALLPASRRKAAITTDSILLSAAEPFHTIR